MRGSAVNRKRGTNIVVPGVAVTLVLSPLDTTVGSTRAWRTTNHLTRRRTVQLKQFSFFSLQSHFNTFGECSVRVPLNLNGSEGAF